MSFPPASSLFLVNDFSPPHHIRIPYSLLSIPPHALRFVFPPSIAFVLVIFVHIVSKALFTVCDQHDRHEGCPNYPAPPPAYQIPIIPHPPPLCLVRTTQPQIHISLILFPFPREWPAMLFNVHHTKLSASFRAWLTSTCQVLLDMMRSTFSLYGRR
jgi:hypothetical protein